MADLRHLATLMLCVAACSPPVHADPITQPRRPRIELRTVKHGWGTIIGAYVRDNELGEPVAPARAEDGKMRCYLPERFVEVQYTETAAEQSVTPTFTPIASPALASCVPCEVGNYLSCDGNPARCYRPDGASQGCCVQ